MDGLCNLKIRATIRKDEQNTTILLNKLMGFVVLYFGRVYFVSAVESLCFIKIQDRGQGKKLKTHPLVWSVGWLIVSLAKQPTTIN